MGKRGEGMESLGGRMKGNYEDRYRVKLTRRTPVIMRLDGTTFHTLTRNCDKPFDTIFSDTMNRTAKWLMSEIQGATCAYIQSDEMSFLLTDFDNLDTDAWFDYNMQKMCSVAAGMTSVEFTLLWQEVKCCLTTGVFDCRAFNVPKEEVCNYFIWRQNDWTRNSLQMLAQAHYSPKQLLNKNSADMHEMLHDKGVNWADLEPRWKNGWFLGKSRGNSCRCLMSSPAPTFTGNREVIEKYLVPATGGER